jgi:hypothetical protein
MTYCNNCGRESHCGEPKFEMMEARKIEICRYCRCDDKKCKRKLSKQNGKRKKI